MFVRIDAFFLVCLSLVIFSAAVFEGKTSRVCLFNLPVNKWHRWNFISVIGTFLLACVADHQARSTSYVTAGPPRGHFTLDPRIPGVLGGSRSKETIYRDIKIGVTELLTEARNRLEPVQQHVAVARLDLVYNSEYFNTVESSPADLGFIFALKC